MRSIDINCDMGESYGRFTVGNDEAIFPYISSCNIACGFHGGDPITIGKTVASAVKHGTRIGAHPSYPDLVGFGRRVMDMTAEELSAAVRYQVSVIKGLAESHQVTLAYVKPHGALYNRIAADEDTAKVTYDAVQSIDPSLAVMGLAGSHTAAIAEKMGVHHIAEAFADRRYTSEGTLMSRRLPGSVLTEPEVAAEQVLMLVTEQSVMTSSGVAIPLVADSICIHGDTLTAVEIAKRMKTVLTEHSITISAT